MERRKADVRCAIINDISPYLISTVRLSKNWSGLK